MPVDFIIYRASSIPSLVTDERSSLKAGVTGSDIVWESGMGKDVGEKLPIETLVPNNKKSSLYIGVTEDFYEFATDRLCAFDDPSIRTLSGFMVATKYPNIAAEVLKQEGTHDVEIFQIPGTDEAVQYAFDCDGVLGIMSSGDTAKANDIIILKTFYDVTVRMIKAAEKLSRRDKEILDDICEFIEIAIQRRRL